MCLLTFLPPGVEPELTALSNGAALNNDGHGFAIVTGERLLVRRDMNAARLIDDFAHTRARHPHGPALFHSRWCTHGATDLDNCHPFAVGGDHRTVIAHNGVLPAIVQPHGSDPRSDTRIAAEDFLPAFGPLRLRRTRLRLLRWMGAVNKMVILTVDRRFRSHAYLLNEDSGIWDGGIWYSNDGYQMTSRWQDLLWDPRWPTPAGHTLDRCWNCGTPTADDGFCTICGWCLDCMLPAEDCLCYLPGRAAGIDLHR